MDPSISFTPAEFNLGVPERKGKHPDIGWCTIPLSAGNKVDPLWQTTRWLRNCEEQCEEDEPIWWPLICPLTDGSDVAMLALAQHLMVAWRWAVTVSPPPICPPASMALNIGQFLNKDTTRHGWSVQQWLEAYTCVLQCIGEATEGRHWRPEGEGFAPKVLLLVEALISMTGAWDAKNFTMSCWSDPSGDVPCQRDEGACANVISYLDELATCWPSRKAWNELVWPPASSVTHMPCPTEHIGYIQGCVVELGLTMPPSWFCMSNQNGTSHED